MKKIFTCIILLAAFTSFAQKGGNVVLSKSQKFTITSTVSSDIDMGMGMPIKNSSTSTSQVAVITDDEKNYTISNTVTKMTVTSDVMGQQTSYDSDKSEDKDSELGKKLSTTLNNPDTLLVDKETGSAIHNKKNESPERAEKGSDENPFGDLMSGGKSDVGVFAAFFVIPKDKKVGDSWSDSTSTKDMKTVKTYTIKSIEKNIAVVLVNMNMNGSFETDMEGTSIPFTMNVKSSGEMTVDQKKSLVNKYNNDIDISGSFEVMGQTMPITAKGNSSAVYQY